MGAISDKLNYLAQTKEAIMNAIIAKGVEVLSSDTFRSYADKIAQITGGGSGGKATNVITENVGVRPTVRDGMKTRTRIDAYSETYDSRITIGNGVSIENGIATFNGTQESNLIKCDISNIYLKVKYVNDSNYNPIITYANSSNDNNGLWLYNGKLGSNYNATNNQFDASVDDDGYFRIRVRWLGSQRYRIYTMTPSWGIINTINITDADGITGSTAYIGGRLNDTYMYSSNIDLTDSYVGERTTPMYLKSYVLINDNSPKP